MFFFTYARDHLTIIKIRRKSKSFIAAVHICIEKFCVCVEFYLQIINSKVYLKSWLLVVWNLICESIFYFTELFFGFNFESSLLKVDQTRCVVYQKFKTKTMPFHASVSSSFISCKTCFFLQVKQIKLEIIFIKLKYLLKFLCFLSEKLIWLTTCLMFLRNIIRG